MPIGPNADGQWVHPNHKCNCGEHQPLPQCADKYCPQCRERQPGPKMQLEAANLERFVQKRAVVTKMIHKQTIVLNVVHSYHNEIVYSKSKTEYTKVYYNRRR